jgi:hypothetical protein
MTHRIVQWTTGNVGVEAVKAVVANPEYELVGCYAWSPDKVGTDVGALCGVGATGVLASNDVDELLALRPDIVSYNPMWFDIDEVIRILESGANIVTTASFITGHSLGEGRQRIIDACERGGSSIFGSGINPGFAHLIAIAAAGASDRVDKITVLESFDISGYDSPATELPVGFNQPPDNPDLQDMARAGTGIFVDAVHLMGDALGVVFDEIVFNAEHAITTQDVDLGSWKIEAGNVAGIAGSWQGRKDDRTLVDLRFQWRKGQTLEPDWHINENYTITIEGRPSFTFTYTSAPPQDFEATTMKEFMVLGMIATAIPAINAIPAVVAARPGILTYADGILPLPKGFARTA